MSVKVDLDELRELLQDRMLPRDEVAGLVEEIKSRSYHVEGTWLARQLLERGFSRGRAVEFFRELGVEDQGIAYLMERATLGDKKDVTVTIGGEEKKGDAAERLRVFREEEEGDDDDNEAGDEEALRELYSTVRGGSKES